MTSWRLPGELWIQRTEAKTAQRCTQKHQRSLTSVNGGCLIGEPGNLSEFSLFNSNPCHMLGYQWQAGWGYEDILSWAKIPCKGLKHLWSYWRVWDFKNFQNLIWSNLNQFEFEIWVPTKLQTPGVHWAAMPPLVRRDVGPLRQSEVAAPGRLRSSTWSKAWSNHPKTQGVEDSGEEKTWKKSGHSRHSPTMSNRCQRCC